MLKLSVRDSINLPTGWETVKITKAVDTEHEGSRCIDLYFEGLPDSLNCRLWSKVDDKTGDDYGICNVFKFTNAGVTVEENGDLTIDDSVHLLHGKTVQILFYTNKNGYTDAISRVIPVPDIGFSADIIKGMKIKAESLVPNKTNGTVTYGINDATTKTVTDNEAVPF